MSFDDAVKKMDAAAMSVFGDATDAVITVPDGAETTLPMILGGEEIDTDYDEQGEHRLTRRSGSVLVADITDLPLDSTVIADGATYRVRAVLEKDHSMIKVDLVKSADTARHEAGRVRRTL